MRTVSALLASLWFFCALFIACPTSQAQSTGDTSSLTAGAFMVRLRGVGVFPIGQNTSITPIGGFVHIDDAILPEVDLTYFLTDHIAIEGEAGVAQNTLTAEDTAMGTVPIGKVWSAPVILVLQYHVLPHSRWNPYFGAGLGVLPYFGAQPAGGPTQQLSVTSEVGATLQAGMDVGLTDHWYGNIDVKKLLIDSYASVNQGAITASGHINPWIVGFGVGYRF